MNVKVTHIISFLEVDNKGPLSGAENHLIDLMVGSKKNSVDVELIALIQRDGPLLRQTLESLEKQGITVTRVSLNPFGRFSLLKTMYHLGKERKGHVIHTHLALACAYGRLGFYLAGCKNIVASWHNDDPSEAAGFQRIKWRLLDPITKLNIAITENVRSHLVQRVGLEALKTKTVYYGIHPPANILSKNETRKILGISESIFALGFIGRLTEQKNIPFLFHAMKKLSEAHLYLIGAGEDLTILEEMKKEMKLDNVFFCGFKKNAADLMPAFDLLVLPSLWEGLGLVLLEGMVRGIPYAGSRNGAIPEILGNGAYGFMLDTPEDLVRLTHDAMNNPEILSEVALKAKSYVLRNFTIQAMVDKTLSLYQSLLISDKLAIS